MENQGYLDIKNERKASKVRNLLKQSKKLRYSEEEDKLAFKLINEANDISDELEEYLEKIYPNKFKIFFYKVDRDIPYDNSLNFLLTNYPEIRKLPLHSIGIINDLWDGYKYIIFNSDDGLDIIVYDDSMGLSPPESFYEFLERMGIMLSQAAKLYKLEEYQTIPIDFLQSSDLWPHIVRSMNKLG